MRGIKIPPQDFALKMQGGLCARGAYLRDTTVSFHHTKFGSHPLSLYRIYGKQEARGCRLAFQA